MIYLVLLDENNKRVTSLVTGVHGKTVEDLHRVATEQCHHEGKRVEMSNEEHNKLLQKEMLEMMPTESEINQSTQLQKLKTKEVKLRQALDEINKEYVTALIDGDNELMEELKAERLELLEMGV